MKKLSFLFIFLSGTSAIFCSQPLTQPGSPLTSNQLDHLKARQEEQEMFMKAQEEDKIRVIELKRVLAQFDELVKTKEGREILASVGVAPILPPFRPD